MLIQQIRVHLSIVLRYNVVLVLYSHTTCYFSFTTSQRKILDLVTIVAYQVFVQLKRLVDLTEVVFMQKCFNVPASDEDQLIFLLFIYSLIHLFMF